MNPNIPVAPTNVYGIPISLHKLADIDKYGNVLLDSNGKQALRCGFKIGGGIDQDITQCPHGYPDKGIYVTYVEERGAADHAGLQAHDKILQVNGIDFTMVTHEKACAIIRKDPVLQLVVYRKGVDGRVYDNKPPPHAYTYQGYDQSSHSNSYVSAPNTSLTTPDKYQ